MALIDDDKVEVVFWVLAKAGAVFRTGHESLENGKENAPVSRNSAVFANLIRLDTNKSIRRKRRKGVKRLISQYVSISQKENAGPAPAITVEVPSALKKLPDNLEGNEGFPCPSGESKQNALLLLSYCVKCLVNRQLLIVAHRFCSTDILKRNMVEVIFPRVWCSKGSVPELFRCRKSVDQSFHAGLHADLVDLNAVGGKCECKLKLFGIVLGLSHPFAHCLFIAFGFDNCKFSSLINQNVVSR